MTGVLLLLALSTTAHAAVPTSITVQGKLTDLSGNPLPAGSKNFTFKIFDAPTLGNEIWPNGAGENQSLTSDAAGLWIGLVGAVAPLTDAVFSDTVRWLEITVDGTTLPRVRLVTGPYAYRVSTIDGASGGRITSKVTIGLSNANTGNDGFVAGTDNQALANYTVIGGGVLNTATGESSVVSGGQQNDATGFAASVAGGANNTASNTHATVGGGLTNMSSGLHSVIDGGIYNFATSTGSVVGGGANNNARGQYSTVAGGGPALTDSNTAGGDFSRIGGGFGNVASGHASSIDGGHYNIASGLYSTIGGGQFNAAQGTFSTIAGGGIANIFNGQNIAEGYATVIGGGSANRAVHNYSTIGGGLNGQTRGAYSTLAGGYSNLTDGDNATVGGGDRNAAAGTGATVSGGTLNYTNAIGAVVAGGDTNSAQGFFAVVGGGILNDAPGHESVVEGGRDNTASGDLATVGGGAYNTASGAGSHISGGFNNTAVGERSTIGGGEQNRAYGSFATVCGGGGGLPVDSNSAAGNFSFVGGGSRNSASGPGAVIAGGDSNRSKGQNSTVGGGGFNVAGGTNATVPGGLANEANAPFTFPAGSFAHANHAGSFVWADHNFLDSFYTTATNQFIIRASSGVGIGTNTPQQLLSVAQGMNIDQANANDGALWNGLSFGSTSGEGIASKRTAGGNQYGLDFYTNSINRVSIANATGYVGFGLTNPSYRIDLPNVANAAGQGRANAWTTYSSRRWKTNITTLSHAVDKVRQLRGVEYDNAADNRHAIGLIAEEVGAVIPEVVQYEANGVDAAALDYGRLVAVLIEAIKEQQRQIDLLNRKLERITP
jgi:hypothetical protein